MRKRKLPREKFRTNVKISNKPTPQKPWVKKPIRYSSYLYLLIISSFRQNVFFTLTNSKGQTKFCTSAGQFGFIGKAKVADLALITTTENFLQKIWNQGIRSIFLIFKNHNRHNYAIVKGIKSMLKKKYPLKFIGLTIKIQTVFNGCRRKKKKRR